ncbi:ABC transporter ATP-binding protein [Aestuariivirga sp.]|uniref:ABC transporter ATP-binding protein n=1 Tax=Aestuariivirga sp. TaxID=2650926 RepID=UPI00391C3CA5
MSSIELERLTKSFPKVGKAVDDISLVVGAGEFVTLLGPSGCGKTTTLRLIAGFEYPDQGTIRVNGEDVTEAPPYRRPVNTVFQDYALFPHMNVERNVGYGMWVAGLPKAEIALRVSEALKMVGLTEKAAARPSELSGGQRQRVALARAIVRRPQVLLLDEPLSALDAKLRESMQVELRHLHRRLGITFLLVTHDQTEAMVMSDRVLIMEQGRVVQDGSPAELYNNPANPYVASFLGTSNLLAADVVAVRGGIITVKLGETVIGIPQAGRGLAAGDPALLAVRPEKSSVRKLAADELVPEGALRGRIIEHHFHGSSVRTSVDVGRASPFLVDTQLSSRADLDVLLPPGATCAVTMDTRSVIAFPGRSTP